MIRVISFLILSILITSLNAQSDLFNKAKKAAKEITERRNLTLSYDCFYNSDATPCSVVLQQKLTKAVMAVQGRSLSLASGAGHDAIAMASLCDVGMLFMRCEGGISHNPLEAIQIEDIKKLKK